MNLRGARVRDDPEINFIPLIDVLLVILIFLMVTTTYQRVAELQITLPEADADAAKALLSIGDRPADSSFDAAELAAMSVVASTLLNLDETVMKE